MREEYSSVISGIEDEQLRRVTQGFIKSVENYESSSLSDLSTRVGAEWIELEFFEDDSDDLIPKGGYGTLLRKLAEPLKIRYGAVVKSIDYGTH